MTVWWWSRGPRRSGCCHLCAPRQRARRTTSGSSVAGWAWATPSATRRTQGFETSSQGGGEPDRSTRYWRRTYMRPEREAEEGTMATTLTSREEAVLERYRARTP